MTVTCGICYDELGCPPAKDVGEIDSCKHTCAATNLVTRAAALHARTAPTPLSLHACAQVLLRVHIGVGRCGEPLPVLQRALCHNPPHAQRGRTRQDCIGDRVGTRARPGRFHGLSSLPWQPAAELRIRPSASVCQCKRTRGRCTGSTLHPEPNLAACLHTALFY